MQVNANPGLKVDSNINFSCIKMFFTAYFLCSLRLFKLKRKGQTIKINIKNLTAKIQDSNQNSHLSWVRLIELWTTRPGAPVLGLAKSV